MASLSRAKGVAGLEDRSSRPHHSPKATKVSLERRIVTLRKTRGLGPARIAGIVRAHPSTVHRVLVRHQINRLDQLDRPTREPIRRMEMTRPGELVHVDIKKLGRIPKGGGWRAHGRAVSRGQHHRTKVGYAFVHSAVDGYTRIAYSEVLANEQGQPRHSSGLEQPRSTASSGSSSNASLTDNGPCYKSGDFNRALNGARHTFIRAYRPQTNGKVERFNRTLLAEWAYARTWTSEGQRIEALTAGSTSTTITDTTPPSVAHPSAASATSQGTTASSYVHHGVGVRPGRRLVPGLHRGLSPLRRGTVANGTHAQRINSMVALRVGRWTARSGSCRIRMVRPCTTWRCS